MRIYKIYFGLLVGLPLCLELVLFADIDFIPSTLELILGAIFLVYQFVPFYFFGSLCEIQPKLFPGLLVIHGFYCVLAMLLSELTKSCLAEGSAPK